MKLFLSTLKKEFNMLLSTDEILSALEEGTIVIDPFTKENLGNSSYDVSLGCYYFREIPPPISQRHEGCHPIHNMYDPESVGRVWGEKSQRAKPLFDSHIELKNISPTDLVIWLDPGESILAHTQEFVGGLKNVNTEMKARSSMGRNFLTVCRCAGWGDVGYINRWTMEITNNSRFHRIPLVVGRRIAQITFSKVTEVKRDSKYQAGSTLEQVRSNWKPEDMLPRMWEDREID
jgi:dCTP deaminase